MKYRERRNTIDSERDREKEWRMRFECLCVRETGRQREREREDVVRNAIKNRDQKLTKALELR